jgi:hypothetical protein
LIYLETSSTLSAAALATTLIFSPAILAEASALSPASLAAYFTCSASTFDSVAAWTALSLASSNF